jgi:hypothetical protein
VLQSDRLGTVFCKKNQANMLTIYKGRKFFKFKKSCHDFDLGENFTNYSLNLLPSFGDNVKSAGPP